MSYDVEKVRKDFPILERRIGPNPLVYLDNAASAQKPRAVLDAMQRYYTTSHANVHRGVHTLSVEATDAYEGGRERVARFIGAASPREIVFVRGTTEAINLVAQAHVRPRVGPGDEILISHLEHHSNIVPWQMVCAQTGAKLQVAAIDEQGDISLEDFARKLGPRTRFVAIAHVSNALGTINPVAELVRLAHDRGAGVLIDGAQAVPHLPVDVAELGCDFYAFSGHKMYGPTGIGALWGRLDRLEETEPWQGGGEMILSVRFDETRYNKVPHKFEAGTPNIAGGVGIGAAADYLRHLDLAAVAEYEDELLAFATEQILEIPGVRVIGTAQHKAGVLSFAMDGVHPHDVGTILDQEGIAVRAGHHCAQPVMERYGVPATTRASFGIYNTRGEVEQLAAGIRRVRDIFGS